jgi:tRNA(Ile)-lysidine synthase
VIPNLTEALDRDPGAGAARSRQLLEEDASALNLLTRERLPADFTGADCLLRADLSALPRALMRRALTAWMDAHGLIESVSAAALDQLIGELETGRVSFRQSAGARFICLSADKVWIEDEEFEAPLEHVQFGPGETVVLSSGFVIESEELLLDDKVRERILRGGVDASTQAVLVMPDELPLDVRSWQAGDRFYPLGAPGNKKLKDWFIDRQIPKKERKLLPVVVNASGEVIWVPGFPPAESCKIDRHTKQALRLTYRPRNSR